MIVNHQRSSEHDTLQKLSFGLTDAQAGPFSVSSESLWCIEELGNYRIKNIPFFIDGISFDDLIAVSRAPAENIWHIQGIVEPSGNSTIWIYAKESAKGAELIEQLIALGCGVEAGFVPDLYALNVPADRNILDVYAVIDGAVEERAIEVDYPSIRHHEVDSGTGA